MTRKPAIWIGAAVLIVAGVGLGIKTFREKLMVHLPDYPSIEKAVWLDQNWSEQQRAWYHHADQGTLTFGIPYEWFVALEQPKLSIGEIKLLSDPTYLDKYGFIPSSTEGKSDELPVGFARGGPMSDPDGKPWLNPQTKKQFTGIGLTCAACHTGRFTYRQMTVLIDGGSALLDLGQLRQGLGISVLFTRLLPLRFGRFANRVLGVDASDVAKAELRNQLDKVWDQMDKIRKLDKKFEEQNVVEGFGRLDALNRIGNQVFSISLSNDDNYVATSAPVHFPRIWDASWFDWVQYNGSIEQPMVRNAGEALGVAAMINLTDPKRPLFQSTVRIDELIKIEQQLAGKQPNYELGFNGLKSPKWPADILPKIDDRLAAEGAELYKSICQECHLPPVSTKEFWDSARWEVGGICGERYLTVELIDVNHIGTDPAHAEDMKNRKVATPPSLDITTNGFGAALGELVEKAVTYWYDGQTPPVSKDQRVTNDGCRGNGIRDPIKYKVRPLNGVWATPPYLHNGSVPTIYALLSPVPERPKTFYLGDREYDPDKLGYKYEGFTEGFKLDTSIRGNHNTGHEFSNDKKSGVIGRFLNPEERRALVEFLKTM
jgi:mono/diheme cytochrome c family protein